MTLYLIPYLNYYNRKIVKFDTVSEYEEKFGVLEILEGVNFIPNDGITTTQIVNYSSFELASGLQSPSYLLVVNQNDEIVSRWWVTESQLIRNGQAKLNLLRDVIADYEDIILNAPAFIQKGWVSSRYDPAIYNNENMSFNQIKTEEFAIKDRSMTGWYVGYIDSQTGAESITIPTTQYTLAAEYDTEEDYPYNAYRTERFIGDYTDFTVRLNYTNGFAQVIQGWDEFGNPKLPQDISAGFDILSAADGTVESLLDRDGLRTSVNDLSIPGPYVVQALSELNIDWKAQSYAFTEAQKGTTVDDFLNQRNKYIRIADTTYRVKITEKPFTDLTSLLNSSPFANKVQSVTQKANELYGSQLFTSTTNGVSLFSAIEYTCTSYLLDLVAVPDSDIQFTLPSTRTHCVDAPYDLIAIPSGKLFIDELGYTSTALSKTLVEKLQLKLGSKAYDWQWLPYCPFEDDCFEWRDGDVGKLLTSTLSTSDFSLIQGTRARDLTVILYPSRSMFEKLNARLPITVPKTDPVEFKVANECDMYRLCSPNFNGQFEFTATKNKGVISWRISCTYKPFSPYIKVNPNFNGLYGSNFDDARGLICGGDFSIAQISDQWQQYQLNNKNYQVMFDRQIENMEVNNAVQRTRERWNVAMGALQGGAAAGMGAGLVGGLAGGVAVGIGGAAASIAGGIADIKLNEKLRAEAMDYARDQFGYQLQNIKAMPHSLTKVAATTEDYKIWPFVEYFTCTDIEKEALRNKIKWNGMTVGRVGTIKSFLKSDDETFIQAKPIRLEVDNNAHLSEVISVELQTGVYIT